MTNKNSAFDRAIGHLVERNMRNWELARSQHRAKEPPQKKDVCEFVSVSHSAGLPREEITSRLGEQLGWPVFDRQILHVMAGTDKHRERVYQCMDERDLSWLEAMLFGLAGDKYNRNDYFHNLFKTVLAIARKGHAVFVGHATDLILPKGHGLRVRVVANRESCVKAYVRERGITVDEASRAIEEIQDERAQFIRHHFHVKADDETRHDLTVNLESFSTDGAVALILAALSARGKT